MLGDRPWDTLYRKAEVAFSVEGQEMLVSLVLEPYGNLVDRLGEGLEVDRDMAPDPSLSVGRLCELIDRHYGWALAIDFADPETTRYFWYYSEEKIEPRRGERRTEAGANKEMPLKIPLYVQELRRALDQAPVDETLARFLLRHPELRHVAARVQIGARYPYAEIRDNLIGANCRPIDILRGKLAYFGAGKFDPKSDLWTRITMYEGAPTADELDRDDADDW